MSTPANHPKTLMEAMRYFSPEVADAYVHSIKWPDGPCCQKCGSTNVGKLTSRRGYQCRDCRSKTSLTKGTIMEGNHF